MSARTIALVAGLAGFLGTVPAWAHHSFAAEFDRSKVVNITGTIIKMEWVNPHAWIHVAAKNPDGTTTEWTFTTGSATTLAGRGIGKNSDVLRAGDVITAKFIPTRDGSPLGFLKSITKADGTVITISAGNPTD